MAHKDFACPCCKLGGVDEFEPVSGGGEVEHAWGAFGELL